MASFGERLRELRKEKQMTQPEVGKILNVGKSTVSQYESGISSPDYDTLKKIADMFATSTDYLLGRTNFRFSFTQANLIFLLSEYEMFKPVFEKKPFSQETPFLPTENSTFLESFERHLLKKAIDPKVADGSGKYEFGTCSSSHNNDPFLTQLSTDIEAKLGRPPEPELSEIARNVYNKVIKELVHELQINKKE